MGLPYNKNYLVITKQQVILVWSAKAACTTVNHMFFDHESLLDIALQYSHWIHHYRSKYQLEQDAIIKKSIKSIPCNRYIQFCVNPYRRAVSSYIHGMSRRYLPEKDKNISFHDFLRRLHAGQIQPNPHHNLQTFYKNDYRLITTVKMEYINEELEKINTKLNLHFKPCKNLNIKRKSNKIDYFVGNDKWETCKDNIPNDYTLFYNDNIKLLVEKIYYKDIKNLGYTWDMFVTYESSKKISN
tara:strand:- start:1001 stop:1726 length:726 start_codon:yes stop_codon:yes gene_type:complete